MILLHYYKINIIVVFLFTGLLALESEELRDTPDSTEFASSKKSSHQNTSEGQTIELVALIVDLFLYTMFSIGTPTQYISFMPFTNVTDLWVPLNASLDEGSYNSTKSSTYVADGRNFVLKREERRKIQGYLSVDTVCAAADLCLKSQYFVECTDNLDIGGLLGLGMSSQAAYNTTSILKSLMNQKRIPKMIFGVWLYKTLKHNRCKLQGGELHLGEVNATKFVEPIHGTPTITNHSWEIDQISDRSGSKIACVSGCNVQLELASPFVFGPAAEIESVNKFIGANQKKIGAAYVIPCEKFSSLPQIDFYIGDKPMRLAAVDYIIMEESGQCSSVFAPSDYANWILGYPVIGSHYSIFDEENTRFGFAQLNK